MYVIADVLKRTKSASPNDIKDALSKTDMMTAFGQVKFISYERKLTRTSLDTYVVQWIKRQARDCLAQKIRKRQNMYIRLTG